MIVLIRPYLEGDLERLVELSLLAWEPIFRSFRQILGSGIYSSIWPDWKAAQREGVTTICTEEEDTFVLVAEKDEQPVGFVACRLDVGENIGEVLLLAVHPDHQNQGIGTLLTTHSLNEMKLAGMRMAKVDTGGDPGHAPARRTYEKADFIGPPLVRYFQVLKD